MESCDYPYLGYIGSLMLSTVPFLNSSNKFAHILFIVPILLCKWHGHLLYSSENIRKNIGPMWLCEFGESPSGIIGKWTGFHILAIIIVKANL